MNNTTRSSTSVQTDPQSFMPCARVAVFPKAYVEKISNGEISLFEWIEMAGTLGADGLELYPLFLSSHETAYLDQVRGAAAQSGLEIPMMCSSPDFTHPDEHLRGLEIQKMKSLIDVMAYLGPESFRSCRVLSGQNHPGITRQDGINRTVEAIGQLLPYAAERKVHLVMENHYKDGFWTYPEFALTSEVFLEIISRISSPWFGINYDPSNAIVAGDDPLELLDQVKHRVITMHASDRYLNEGYTIDDIKAYKLEGYSKALTHGVIGQGMNDYAKIFQTLQFVRFRGWISIEDGINGMEEMRESVKFIREMIVKYLKTK